MQVVCKHYGRKTDITHPGDFSTLVGGGGCQLSCGTRLPCGHTCPRRCHPDDPQHVTTRCLEPCAKLCAAGDHPCSKLCYAACGMCQEPVQGVKLPCGHTATVTCHM